jgi:DNA-binding NarL/FixJ family response regulator
MSGKLAILIVDPDRFRRLGILGILRGRWPDLAVGQANSYRSAIDQLGKQSWDLALVELNLPGWQGLDLISDIASKWKIPTLAMSVEPEELYGLRAMRSGSAGYYRRDQQQPEAVIPAISAVLESGRYLTPRMAELLAQRLKPGDQSNGHFLSVLSDRELQVLRALAEGQRIKEVAANLSLSSKTVSTYRARIFEKLQLNNDAELVAYCLKLRLIS